MLLNAATCLRLSQTFFKYLSILYSTGNIRHFSLMKNEVDSYGYFVHILYPESKKKAFG